MSNYRHVRVAGASYFFTVHLADRGSRLLTDRIGDLRRAYGTTVAAEPVRCDAIVVLPNHLHAVWTLPAGDSGYPERWRKIKYRFSRAVGLHFPRSASKRAKRETGVWQRRYWEHTIRDEADWHRHVAYCWANPVRHGLVARAADWPFSSIHREIRRGGVGAGWSGVLETGRYGE